MMLPSLSPALPLAFLRVLCGSAFAEGRNFHPPHPGVGVLLKTNIKPQFDKAVIRQSKLLFCLVSVQNPVGLLALLLLVASY